MALTRPFVPHCIEEVGLAAPPIHGEPARFWGGGPPVLWWGRRIGNREFPTKSSGFHGGVPLYACRFMAPQVAYVEKS